MKPDLLRQKKYWDSEVENFDSIYTHSKSEFSNWLDKKLRWDMYARFEYTMKNSHPIENSVILDVGCGTGLYSLEFARRKAKKVLGIDISENMIDVCIERSKEEKLDRVCEFITSDLPSFNSEEKFDVIIGIGLFDYIENPEVVINKMKLYCSGKTILSFPRSATLRSIIRKIRLKIRGCDVYFYSEEKINRLIKDAGFSRYEIKILGQLYCVTAYKN